MPAQTTRLSWNDGAADMGQVSSRYHDDNNNSRKTFTLYILRPNILYRLTSEQPSAPCANKRKNSYYIVMHVMKGLILGVLIVRKRK